MSTLANASAIGRAAEFNVVFDRTCHDEQTCSFRRNDSSHCSCPRHRRSGRHHQLCRCCELARQRLRIGHPEILQGAQPWQRPHPVLSRAERGQSLAGVYRDTGERDHLDTSTPGGAVVLCDDLQTRHRPVLQKRQGRGQCSLLSEQGDARERRTMRPSHHRRRVALRPS